MQQAAQELEAKREEIEAARAEALEALAAQDRASARNMQVGMRSVMPPLLGCFVVVTAGFTEFRILTHGIHPGLEPVVAGRILGNPGRRGAAGAQFLLRILGRLAPQDRDSSRDHET